MKPKTCLNSYQHRQETDVGGIFSLVRLFTNSYRGEDTWGESPPTKNRIQDSTCPADGGDGTEGQRSAEAARKRWGGRLALTRALRSVDELGQVGGRAEDEGVHLVQREQRRLAAEGGRCWATCKVSATQEQRTGPNTEVTVINTLHSTKQRMNPQWASLKAL